MDPTFDPLSILTIAANAFHSHAWAMLSGAILTILVIIMRQFDLVSKLPDKLVPWATVVLAIIGSVGLGLQQGQSLSDVIVTGLSIGWMAVGVWETAGKMGKSSADALKARFTVVPKAIEPADETKVE